MEWLAGISSHISLLLEWFIPSSRAKPNTETQSEAMPCPSSGAHEVPVAEEGDASISPFSFPPEEDVSARPLLTQINRPPRASLNTSTDLQPHSLEDQSLVANTYSYSGSPASILKTRPGVSWERDLPEATQSSESSWRFCSASKHPGFPPGFIAPRGPRLPHPGSSEFRPDYRVYENSYSQGSGPDYAFYASEHFYNPSGYHFRQRYSQSTNCAPLF